MKSVHNIEGMERWQHFYYNYYWNLLFCKRFMSLTTPSSLSLYFSPRNTNITVYRELPIITYLS